MKRVIKSMLGVTLLEIMLVLAIAAMVIVMSVRYYQSAQSSSQANAYVGQIQAYVSAAENLAQAGNGFVTDASKTKMEALLPGGANAWRVPWGGAAGTYTPTATGFTFAPATNPSPATCALIQSKLGSDATKKLSAANTTCTVTYNASLS